MLIEHSGIGQEVAGLIVLLSSLVNVFARPLGGLISDAVSKANGNRRQPRVHLLFVLMLAQALLMLLFGVGGSMLNNVYFSIAALLCFDVAVCCSGGVSFSIVPFVEPSAAGTVAGFVGAGANVGATAFAIGVFTFVPHHMPYEYGWTVLGACVLLASFSVPFLRFRDRECGGQEGEEEETPNIQLAVTRYELTPLG